MPNNTDMNNLRFRQLINEVEVGYDGDLATVLINKDGVLIDVYMWNDDEELQIESLSVNLTTIQKRIIERKIGKHIQEYNNENNVEEDAFSECGFTQDDYNHFESLIHV